AGRATSSSSPAAHTSFGSSGAGAGGTGRASHAPLAEQICPPLQSASDQQPRCSTQEPSMQSKPAPQSVAAWQTPSSIGCGSIAASGEAPHAASVSAEAKSEEEAKRARGKREKAREVTVGLLEVRIVVRRGTTAGRMPGEKLLENRAIHRSSATP